MFTGIIEALGTIVAVENQGSNRHFTVASPFAAELKIDQSVAHDGVCLTVVAVDAAAGTHVVTAIDETLRVTNLGQWQPGRHVNLERCLAATGRFDGHIVQGHVDATATCLSVEDQQGSWLFRFGHAAGPRPPHRGERLHLREWHQPDLLREHRRRASPWPLFPTPTSTPAFSSCGPATR